MFFVKNISFLLIFPHLLTNSIDAAKLKLTKKDKFILLNAIVCNQQSSMAKKRVKFVVSSINGQTTANNEL